ncbi:MAG: hypothetical protein JWN49_92 [Parcubacteria group bacterium]|nr:hypothetical protein [Parcubacteria group bacterium]
MNTNTSEFLKKWGGILVTLVLLIVAGLFITYSKKSAPVTPSDSAALYPGLASTSASAQTGAGTSKPVKGLVATPVTTNATYTNPSWAIKFTVRGDWTLNTIPDSTGKLHQVQLSGTKNVVFISKDEAIGLSGDLAYTTSTRTIDGQTVTVRTYKTPSSQFAVYQLFTLKAADGNYSFLIKNVSADTSQTDSFINSISNS